MQDKNFIDKNVWYQIVCQKYICAVINTSKKESVICSDWNYQTVYWEPLSPRSKLTNEYTLLQDKRWRWYAPPSHTTNFRRTKLTPTKYIIRRGRIHFKYWKNILISQLYEQFSRNDSAMAPEKKFKLLKYERIVYSFEARDLEISNMHYFCEISKFRDFMNTLRKFAKSVLAYISAKF